MGLELVGREGKLRNAGVKGQEWNSEIDEEVITARILVYRQAS